jgi:hypothetical protein
MKYRATYTFDKEISRHRPNSWATIYLSTDDRLIGTSTAQKFYCLKITRYLIHIFKLEQHNGFISKIFNKNEHN